MLLSHFLVFALSTPFRLAMLCLFYLQLSVFMLSSPVYMFTTSLRRRVLLLVYHIFIHPSLLLSPHYRRCAASDNLLSPSFSCLPRIGSPLYFAHHSLILSPLTHLPYGFVGRGSRLHF